MSTLVSPSSLNFREALSFEFTAGAPLVGVKTGGSRVGGPDLCIKADGNRKQGTQMFTQVRALSMEVKPYFLLN